MKTVTSYIPREFILNLEQPKEDKVCADCGHELYLHGPEDETNRLPCSVKGCPCTAYGDAL